MNRTFRFAMAILLAVLGTDGVAFAQRNKSNVRSSSRTSVSREKSTSVNTRRDVDVNRRTDVDVDRRTNVDIDRRRNIDVDRDIDIDIDRDIDIDVDRRYGCCYNNSGWGTAAAIATTAAVTAAVVGSMTPTLPPGCSLVMVNGFTYQQCGTVWYQPQISGTSTTYLVVTAPR
jgi:hypothetical protein